MTPTVNPNRAGLVVGLVLAGWHFVWAVLVAAGWAQPVIDFIFWLHMIKPVYVVDAFDAVRAILLVAVTGAIGYAIGAGAGVAWNRVYG